MSEHGGSRHGIPDFVMEKIDKYVDSLAPEIQPRIASEIDEFQTKTIDSLEDLVVDAFRSLFNREDRDGRDRDLGDAPPDSYGVGSLPFANEIVQLTRSFSKVADEAGDDLRDIFNITEGGGGGGGGGDEERSRGGGGDMFSQGARGFLSAAIDAVKEHRRDSSGGGDNNRVSFDGLLGVLADTIKETSRDPEGKARLISPEIKDKLSGMLREQHAPLAEQFTTIALGQIKRWLRGNTTTRDLGDGVKGEMKDEIAGMVKGIAGMFGRKKDSDDGERSRSGPAGDRDDDGRSGGFSGVISDKLSTGLAKVHREVRVEFRKTLGIIEKNLWEALPDQVQGPLEKILGGNPFDSSLDGGGGDQHTASRGFRDDIKAKLVSKIRDLVRKVQESLRQSVLGVVNGGHRKFERASWIFVHENVERRVRKYLPEVRIEVPDDIGNEGVSVGSPQTPQVMQPGGGGSGGGGGGGGNPDWQQGGGAQHGYYGSQQPASYQYPQQSQYGGQYGGGQYSQYPHHDQGRPHYQ